MATSVIGGLAVDLTLKSATFIRDLGKAADGVNRNTKAISNSLGALNTAFAAVFSARMINKIVSFTDESLKLATTLNGPLAAGARNFLNTAERFSGAFELGVAQGFLDAVKSGLSETKVSFEELAAAGIVAGNIIGRAFTTVVNFFTHDIPEGIRQSIEQINALITAWNKFAKDQFAIPLLDTSGIQSTIATWVDLSSAVDLAGQSYRTTSDGALLAQRSGEELSRMAAAQEQLYSQIRTPMEAYEAQLARINYAQLGAAETAKLVGQAQAAMGNEYLKAGAAVTGALADIFKENKAVAVANAFVNTAEAVTAALKNPPGPPFSFAYAAAAAAAGAAQIAAILSAKPGGSSSVPRAGSSGGASGAAKASSTGGGGGGGGGGPGVNVYLRGGGGYTDEQVTGLMDRINEVSGQTGKKLIAYKQV